MTSNKKIESVDLISKIQTKKFTYKNDPNKEKRTGFMANELEKIAPFAVTGNIDDVDENGKPIYQAIKHGALVPDIVAALQWCILKIKDLEEEIKKNNDKL